MAATTCCTGSKPPTVSRKTVLFCSGCDYESPVDGDWHRSKMGEETFLVCPRCAETIARCA